MVGVRGVQEPTRAVHLLDFGYLGSKWNDREPKFVGELFREANRSRVQKTGVGVINRYIAIHPADDVKQGEALRLKRARRKNAFAVVEIAMQPLNDGICPALPNLGCLKFRPRLIPDFVSRGVYRYSDSAHKKRLFKGNASQTYAGLKPDFKLAKEIHFSK